MVQIITSMIVLSIVISGLVSFLLFIDWPGIISRVYSIKLFRKRRAYPKQTALTGSEYINKNGI